MAVELVIRVALDADRPAHRSRPPLCGISAGAEVLVDDCYYLVDDDPAEAAEAAGRALRGAAVLCESRAAALRAERSVRR